MEDRLHPSQLPAHRARLQEEQGQSCPLCSEPIKKGDNVHLDHCHKTGRLRSALHGACNMALGKLERAARMTPNPQVFLESVGEYIRIHRENPSPFLHPTFLTRDERNLKLKKRAIRRRKKASNK